MVLSNRKRSSTSLPSTCRVFSRNLMAMYIFLCIQILRVLFVFSHVCLLFFMSPPPQKNKHHQKKRVVRLTFSRSTVPVGGMIFVIFGQMMSKGWKKSPKSKVTSLRFHETILSSGEPGSLNHPGWKKCPLKWSVMELQPSTPGVRVFPHTLAGIQRCILAPKYSTLSPASKRVGLGGPRKMWKKTCK